MILGIDFGFYSVKVVIFDNNKISAIGEKNIIEDLNRFGLSSSTVKCSLYLDACITNSII